MPQYSETTPLEDRASKHITLGQFMRETWPVPAAWLSGAAAGVLFSKAKGYQSGTPAAQLAMMIPAKLGAFFALFMMWRKKEKEHIGIGEIYDKYKDARALRMTNEELLKENSLLKQMVEFEERQQEHPKHVQEILSHGPRGHVAQAVAGPAEIVPGR